MDCALRVDGYSLAYRWGAGVSDNNGRSITYRRGYWDKRRKNKTCSIAIQTEKRWYVSTRAILPTIVPVSSGTVTIIQAIHRSLLGCYLVARSSRQIQASPCGNYCAVTYSRHTYSSCVLL